MKSPAGARASRGLDKTISVFSKSYPCQEEEWTENLFLLLFRWQPVTWFSLKYIFSLHIQHSLIFGCNTIFSLNISCPVFCINIEMFLQKEIDVKNLSWFSVKVIISHWQDQSNYIHFIYIFIRNLAQRKILSLF